MDFSGIFIMTYSCFYMAIIPAIAAAVAWGIAYTVIQSREIRLGKLKGSLLFMIWYVLSLLST
jgi:hypothetical protein